MAYGIAAYGIGHALNDLTLACWYNYLIYFYKKVLLLVIPTGIAFAGQITVAVVTPIIGYLSGKCNTPIGQRMPWYIFSIFLTIITTVLLYSGFKSQNGRIEGLFYFTSMFFSCFSYASM